MLKDQPLFPSRGFWVALLVGLGVLAFLMGPCAFHAFEAAGRKAGMHEALSNARMIKLAMDAFAMDHDGMYPNEETAKAYGIPADGSSDALFRQLFASGNLDSERIFWIEKHPLCAKRPPDDVITAGGVFAPEETLQAGDNGWAYVMDQTNTDNPSRPFLFVSPLRGSGLEFDPEIWNKKVMMLRIDGSVKPERLNAENRLMDGDNKELLTTQSAVWGEDVEEVKIAYPARWEGP